MLHMQIKSNNGSALWFILLLAVIFAAACVFVYWIGKKFLFHTDDLATTPSTPVQFNQPTEPQQVQVPILPPAELEEEEEIVLPAEVAEMMQKETLPSQEAEPIEKAPVSENNAQVAAASQPITASTTTVSTTTAQTAPAPADTCPATAVPVRIKKPSPKATYTRYEQGLLRCKKNGVFPCAWEEKTNSQRKQYWVVGSDGPIMRGVYDEQGNLLSETIATINGTVTKHTENGTVWTFQAGVLTKIRTSPYDNCNLHDWFFINEAGKQDVCQCVYATALDCCARSPYQEGMARSYCDLFPNDQEFCK